MREKSETWTNIASIHFNFWKNYSSLDPDMQTSNEEITYIER